MPYGRHLLAALLLACLLSACGGGGKDTSHGQGATPAKAGPEKERFIQAADGACRKASGRVAKLNARVPKKGPSPAKLRKASRLYAQGSRVAAGLARQLRRLRSPARDQATIARYIAAIQQQSRLLAEASGDLRRGDAPAVQKLSQRMVRVAALGHTIAKRYGFRFCGQRG
jgi:hypothetical protein